LTDAQRRLWLTTQLVDENAAYNMSGGIGINGNLNIDALTQSLTRIVQRHDILRTNIELMDGKPVQVIHNDERDIFPLSLIQLDSVNSLDSTSVDSIDQIIQTHLSEEANTPFDLARDALVRGRLLILGNDRYVLINTMHHIVSDGWSMGVMVRELSTIYAALVAGDTPKLQPLPIQYADYAHWQQHHNQQKAIAQ